MKVNQLDYIAMNVIPSGTFDPQNAVPFENFKYITEEIQMDEFHRLWKYGWGLRASDEHVF